MNPGIRIIHFFLCCCVFIAATGCDRGLVESVRDDSPTSGHLKLYYDEGLDLHVKNQAYTFSSQYDNAHLELFVCTDDAAVSALLKDSCESIIVSRRLNEQETRAFAAKQFHPAQTPVAKSGMALICASSNTVHALSPQQLALLGGNKSTDHEMTGGQRLLFDRSNSSIAHYFRDSVLKGMPLGNRCSASANTKACIAYVAEHPTTIGVIDFAWLSDRDDNLFKEWKSRIRFIGIVHRGDTIYPSQSSFKTGDYPFTRTVYIIRKTGDFTLAKGFETFVAGQKGQLTFLKQGLLPNRQEERTIQVKFEPVGPVE
jgi:phosphate transport system substrate-binding protein